jgi:general secretion pathway protein G
MKKRGVKVETGFTTIELLTVVTIIGILVTLAQPSFHSSVVKAREVALKHSMFVMRDVIDQYRSDKGGYPTMLQDLVKAGYLKAVPADPFTRSTETWQEMVDPTEGGVSDVHSGSMLVAMDGTPYNQW